MVEIKHYADLAASNASKERKRNCDPVGKLKLIPDRFFKSPPFYKISFFFCLVGLHSRTTC